MPRRINSPANRKERSIATISCWMIRIAVRPFPAYHMRAGQSLPYLRHCARRATRFPAPLNMVEQMGKEGFGSCRNYGKCEAQCPKEISIKFIGQLNCEYLNAALRKPINHRGKMAPQ